MIDSLKVKGQLAKKGMTQEELGKALGIHSQSVFNRLQRGNWRVGEVEQMMKIFNCSLSDLMKEVTK